MNAEYEENKSNIALEVKGIGKTFKKNGVAFEALKDVNMTIERNEFISIIGPSGCGKSTLFHIIAGILTPNEGQIIVDGEDMTGRTDKCALMPQKDLLFPWRKVADNTILGLQIAGMKKKEARAKVEPYFKTFGIDGTQELYPAQLSGGMRQRAALLRTVVQGRSVLLLDEPFGALDSLTRSELQDWLLDIWQREKWTVILVTHDIKEAIYLSDKVYVMAPSPSHVQEVIHIDLPRPRNSDTMLTPEFLKYEVYLKHTFDRH